MSLFSLQLLNTYMKNPLLAWKTCEDSLNVQAELNIVRNFGLFSAEMKAFGEPKVREERFDFNTAFAFINTLLCVLLGADIPLELSYDQ